MNYLNQLSIERGFNPAVWDYSGPVNTKQVDRVCGLALPMACCDCGGTGITNTIQKQTLAAWALTCNTYTAVTDGGVSAVNCWTSYFKQSCVDYDNLLEVRFCDSGSGSGANGTSQESGSGGSGSSQNSGSSITVAASSTTISTVTLLQTLSTSDGLRASAPNHRFVNLGASIVLVIMAVGFLLIF